MGAMQQSWKHGGLWDLQGEKRDGKEKWVGVW